MKNVMTILDFSFVPCTMESPHMWSTETAQLNFLCFVVLRWIDFQLVARIFLPQRCLTSENQALEFTSAPDEKTVPFLTGRSMSLSFIVLRGSLFKKSYAATCSEAEQIIFIICRGSFCGKSWRQDTVARPKELYVVTTKCRTFSK